MKLAEQLKTIAEILMEHKISKEFQIYTRFEGRGFEFTDGLFFHAFLKPTETPCEQPDNVATVKVGDFLYLAVDFGDDSDILLSDERVIGYPYFSFILGDDLGEHKVYLDILDYKETIYQFFDRQHPENHFVLKYDVLPQILEKIKGQDDVRFECHTKMPLKLHINAVVSDFDVSKGVVQSFTDLRFVGDCVRSLELFLENVQSDVKIAWDCWGDYCFAEVSGYLGDGFVTLRYFTPEVEIS